MSEGHRDVWEQLSETVDRTCDYIRAQRAQNKTRKKIIAKQLDNTIQRTVELLETKRQKVLSQEEAALVSHQNEVNIQELDDLNMTIQYLKIDATRLKSENSKVSVDRLRTIEEYNARIASAEKEADRIKAEHVASLESTKAEKDAAARAEVDRLRAEHLATLESTKAEKDAATQAEVDRLTAEHAAQLEQTRIQAKDAAVLELEEKARLKQLEVEKKQREELEEAEQRRAFQEQQDELLRQQRERDAAVLLQQQQERDVPDDAVLNEYILQLLIYYACPKPRLPEMSWNAIKRLQPPKNERFDWYARLLRDLQSAREHYNNVRPIKTFLVVRDYPTLPPLITVEANTIVVKTLEGGLIRAVTPANVPDVPFKNNFTVISKGDIQGNFETMLPKFVTTDGTIAHERTIVVYGPSGTGKTSQIHKFIDFICQSQNVEYYVVELYGYDFTNPDVKTSMVDGKKRTDELMMFLLEHQHGQQPYMQVDVNQFPKYESGRKLVDYRSIQSEDQLKKRDLTLLFRGNADDIKKTMNSGVYKKTSNNDQSSRGFIFIKIRVNEKTYCLCDFPGSEENMAQESTVYGKRNSYLIGESLFFSKMLPYFQRLFEAKAQKKEMVEPLPFVNVPPVVSSYIKEWFIDRSVAMVFTALGNYNKPTDDEVRRKNYSKYNLSLKLFEFVANLDGREECVSQEEAVEYFGEENMRNPTVKSLIKSSSSKGGSKNKMTRKRYGRKCNTRRFRR